jgi:hypothetical protein
VSNSTISQLQKENGDLRTLVVQLSHIVLKNVLEKTGLPKLPNSEAAMAPTEIVVRLRELAVRYARLRRLCADPGTAEELDSLSVEIAEAAQRMESLFS